MIESNGYFTGDNNIDGVNTIVGTDANRFTDLLAEAPSGRCYVSGMLINMTPQEYNLKIVGDAQVASVFTIRGYEGVRFTKMPMKQLRVAVNGTIRLRALGLVVDPINDVDGHDRSILNIESGLFIEMDVGRSYIYDQETHTDITTATTTTVFTPTTGFTGRMYKITISAQAAARITLETSDSDGTSNLHVIGIINFAAEGSFVYDFADKGKSITNGVDGLIRVITNNTAVVDIDVVGRSD